MADEHGGEEERENTRVVIVHDRQSACWGMLCCSPFSLSFFSRTVTCCCSCCYCCCCCWFLLGALLTIWKFVWVSSFFQRKASTSTTTAATATSTFAVVLRRRNVEILLRFSKTWYAPQCDVIRSDTIRFYAASVSVSPSSAVGDVSIAKPV